MRHARICCVPLCPSKSGTPGISLHEIPSDPDVRERWLRVISRADSINHKQQWMSGSRSAVCSRHFLETDFISGHKQKRLLKDAVPSVFPEYPSYKIPKDKPPRKSPKERNYNFPRKRKKTETATAVSPVFTQDEALHEPRGFGVTFHEKKSESIQLRKRINILRSKRTVDALKRKVNVLQCAIRRKDNLIMTLLQDVQRLKSEAATGSTSLKKIEADADQGKIKALLLLQQIEAYGKQRFNWSEICLRMCVLWKTKSPRAYNFARNKLINLPSPSTLQKCLGPSSLETGLTRLARVRLTEELKNLSKMDLLCRLIFDDMTITPKALYRKQADKVVGKAEYGRGVSSSTGGLANRILCFVLKGLSANYRIPVAYYLTCQLQGNQLATLLTGVIKDVEEIGFRICRLVSDDATTNVKAFEIICQGEISHEIVHPCRPSDPLFISFDPCHIIKNVRNQFIDESRNWNRMGESISAKPIKILYDNQKFLPVKPVRFLTRKSVYPTNFEKMNVKRAIQIFSTEVIAALEFCKFKNLPGFINIEETLQFMKYIQKWFLIHNVCNTTHYITCRDETRKHFGMIDDERLEWLGGEFLDYLESWDEFARTNKSTKSRKVTMLLTPETFSAMKVTTRSTIACVRYLLASGFHFVLTRKFNSDDVEGIFSAVRASQGYNDQANAVGSLYALETILKTEIFSSSSFGNCGDTRTDTIEEAFSKRNVIGRVMPSGSLIELSPEQEELARKLDNPPDISNVTIKTAGVAMIAGFILRLLKDKHPCPDAGRNLTGDYDEATNILIFLQDRGGLSYPSRFFVCFVKLVFDILDLSNNIEHDALVKSWKMTFMNLLSDDALACGCLDSCHTNQNRELILQSLCKIYFNNVCFNSSNAVNDKPKFTAKPLSKKVKKL